jgi:hypothetical protein
MNLFWKNKGKNKERKIKNYKEFFISKYNIKNQSDSEQRNKYKHLLNFKNQIEKNKGKYFFLQMNYNGELVYIGKILGIEYVLNRNKSDINNNISGKNTMENYQHMMNEIVIKTDFIEKNPNDKEIPSSILYERAIGEKFDETYTSVRVDYDLGIKIEDLIENRISLYYDRDAEKIITSKFGVRNIESLFFEEDINQTSW